MVFFQHVFPGSILDVLEDLIDVLGMVVKKLLC